MASLFKMIGSMGKKIFNTAVPLGGYTSGTPVDPASEISYADSSLFKGYQNKGYNPDDLVTRKNLDIYDEMRNTDDQVKACLNIKKHSILSNGWDVIAAEGEDGVKDFIKDCLQKVEGGLIKNLRRLLTGIEFGFSITEKVYFLRDDGMVGLKSLKTRAPHTFRLETNAQGHLDKIIQNTSAEGDIVLPSDKFIVFSYSPSGDFDNPYGQSDLRAAYRPYFMKDFATKFWAMYLEKFGSPIVDGSWTPTASAADKKELNDILDNIQTMTTIAHPDTLMLKFIEVARGGEQAFKEFITRQNTAIARAVLCPELLGFTDVNMGSYALGKKQFDIYMVMINDIRGEIQELINEQLIKPLVNFNFNTYNYPKFKFNPITEENKQEELKIFIDAVLKGILNATPEDEDYFRKVLNAPERDKTAPVEPPPATGLPIQPNGLPGSVGAGVDETINPEGLLPGIPALSSKVKVKTFAKKSDLKFAERVDFKQVEKDLDKSELGMAQDIVDVINKIRNTIETQILKDGIIDDGDMKSVRDMSIKYVGELKDAFKNGLREVVKQGFRDVRVEINKGKKTFAVEFFKTRAELLAATYMTPKAAIYFLEEKSFMLAGIEGDYIKKNVQLIMANGIKNGKMTNEIIYEIENFFDKNYTTIRWESGAKAGEDLTQEELEARLNTVIRTNTTEAYNLGRLSSMRDPELGGFVEAVEFAAIMDDRTTDVCEELNGTIVSLDDPFSQEINPPLHFNCRSVLIPVTKFDDYQVSEDTPNLDDYPEASGFYSLEHGHKHKKESGEE